MTNAFQKSVLFIYNIVLTIYCNCSVSLEVHCPFISDICIYAHLCELFELMYKNFVYLRSKLKIILKNGDLPCPLSRYNV